MTTAPELLDDEVLAGAPLLEVELLVLDELLLEAELLLDELLLDEALLALDALEELLLEEEEPLPLDSGRLPELPSELEQADSRARLVTAVNAIWDMGLNSGMIFPCADCASSHAPLH